MYNITVCSGIIIENVSINLFATDEQLRDVGLYYVIIFQTEIFSTNQIIFILCDHLFFNELHVKPLCRPWKTKQPSDRLICITKVDVKDYFLQDI